MNPTIHITDQPCDQIEHWQAAEIRNDENTNTLPACWLQVGETMHIIYWINGAAFHAVLPVKSKK